ncbi:MAG: DMT family transporter [Candidatus Solibacter usitatus]|nr:DMT family transporter [Candidatus Solibacter usitatus]
MTSLPAQDPRHLRAELAIVSVAFMWGSTFVIVKSALNDVSTFLFLGLRFTLAAVLLAIVLRGRLSPGSTSPAWRGGFVSGALLFAGYALQTSGLRLTSVSRSAFITGLFVVLVPLLSSAVKQVRPHRAELLGAVCALIGTFLMTSGDLNLKPNTGDLLTLGGAFAYSGHMLAVAHYSRRTGFERLSVLQVAFVALFAWLAAAVAEPPHIIWSGRLLFALLFTAAFATALCLLMYTWAQRHTSASRAALLFALEPVFAGLIAWLFAGESWTGRALIGAALILSGIVLVEVKPSWPSPHQDG